MRLWHIDLIPYLPSVKDYKGCSNQLGGQYVEIRMILGSIKKHGKVNHSTVNYVNNHSLSNLRAYGLVVIEEMIKRGFNVDDNILGEYADDECAVSMYNDYTQNHSSIYPEHNEEYKRECLENLKNKGILLQVE